MSENQFKRNLILNFNADKAYAVMPTVLAEEFYYVFPISLDRSSSNLISKIQLVTQNNETFSSTFTSMFFNETSNYKKFINNESIDLINNSHLNNVYLDYNNKQSTAAGRFFKEILFDANNFVVEQGNQTNLYNIIFPVSFSRTLYDDSIRNLRVLFIDNKNSVIDQTDVVEVSFSNIKIMHYRLNAEQFYRTYYLNDFANSASLSLIANLATVQSSNEIDTNVFERINVSIKYNNIEVSRSYNTNNDNTYVSNISSIVRQVASDLFINDVQTANIDVVFSLSSQALSDIRLQKSFSYDKNSSFARSCLAFSKPRLVVEKMNQLGFEQSISFKNNKLEISLNIEDDASFLEKVYVTDIKKNNNSISHLYTGIDLTLENKLDYRGKSLANLFFEGVTNDLFYIHSGSSRECIIEVTLNFLDTDSIFTSNKIIATSDYSTSIENTNKIFNRNLNISKVELNRPVNDQKSSILLYKNITLDNFDSFNDIAYSLGYVADNQADIRSFLENCLVKIETQTTIKRLDFVTNKTKYFFFRELFDTSTYNSGIIEIRQAYINNYIHTDDYFELNNLKVDSLNENIFRFFTTNDEENAFKFLIREKDVNVSSRLVVKVLPLPKVLIEYRGKGLDNTLGNPIDNVLYSDITDVDDIVRKRLSRELVMFFYTGNTNFNWDRFNALKAIFFDEDKTSDVLNYSSFFDNLIDVNVNNNNVFTSKTTFKREDLLLAINTNDSYINSPEKKFGKKTREMINCKLCITTWLWEKEASHRLFNFHDGYRVLDNPAELTGCNIIRKNGVNDILFMQASEFSLTKSKSAKNIDEQTLLNIIYHEGKYQLYKPANKNETADNIIDNNLWIVTKYMPNKMFEVK